MENRVYIADCEDYNIDSVTAAVERTLDAFGGAGALLNGGKRVLVKPNMLIPKKPEDAATTHPIVVEAVCAAFVKAGADVSIIDSTGGPHTKIVLRLLSGKTGIKDAAKRSGAKISFNMSTRKVTYPEGKILQNFDILAPVFDADLVVNVAKAKTHCFMTMTGCVKNLFGCIPGMGKPLLHRKYPKHEDFAAMLVDICEYINPGFSILDAVYGMEGQGPASGDPKHIGVIAGGISPYAVDVAQCYLMGQRAERVHTIQDAVARGLVSDDPDLLTWLGENPSRFRKSFKPAINHKNNNIPKILRSCTGCGDCARICPMKCIKITDGKTAGGEIATDETAGGKTTTGKIAVIEEKDCIKCYCCHEFCPAKSITLD